MKLSYQEEAIVWLNYEIPLDVVLDYNKDEKSLDDLLSVEKAIENGLDINDYFDDEHYKEMRNCNETGETYQAENNYETVMDLLNEPEIMGDEYLMNFLMGIITKHQKNKNK